MKIKPRQECGVILPNDTGSDYICDEPQGHDGDHHDSEVPISWPHDVVRVTQGQFIREQQHKERTFELRSETRTWNFQGTITGQFAPGTDHERLLDILIRKLGSAGFFITEVEHDSK